MQKESQQEARAYQGQPSIYTPHVHNYIQYFTITKYAIKTQSKNLCIQTYM